MSRNLLQIRVFFRDDRPGRILADQQHRDRNIVVRYNNHPAVGGLRNSHRLAGKDCWRLRCSSHCITRCQ